MTMALSVDILISLPLCVLAENHRTSSLRLKIRREASATSKHQYYELREADFFCPLCAPLSAQKFREPFFPAEKFAKSLPSSQKLGEALLASEEFGESAAAAPEKLRKSLVGRRQFRIGDYT